jgi:hypothetical protein
MYQQVYIHIFCNCYRIDCMKNLLEMDHKNRQSTMYISAYVTSKNVMELDWKRKQTKNCSIKKLTENEYPKVYDKQLKDDIMKFYATYQVDSKKKIQNFRYQ